jgi:glycosyltransferase involved in cell wall biosynthesis
MKVVHTAASLEDMAGGPSYIIPALVAALAKQNYDASLFSIAPQDTIEKSDFLWHKFANQWSRMPGLYKLQASSKMNMTLHQQNAHVIHNHGLWLMPNIYGSRVKAKSGQKLITSVHGMLAPEAMRYSKIPKKIFSTLYQNHALANTDLFHVTSSEELDQLRRAGLRQPIALVPLGISVEQTHIKNKDQNQKVILYLGRIHPIKRLGDLVEAWSELALSHPDWCVKIIGPDDGQEGGRLHDQIIAKKIPRIEILDAVFGIEKSAIFASASLYILPSQSENFSLTVAEALAHGVPVISSKGAPWSNLEAQKCGWWCDVGVAGLKQALSKALSTPPEKLEAMGENGKHWMERDFSIITMAKKMATTYEWLVSGGMKPDFVHLVEDHHG